MPISKMAPPARRTWAAGSQEDFKMRGKCAVLSSLIVLCVMVPVLAKAEDVYSAARTASGAATPAPDPLLQLLVKKGVLNSEEARSLSGTPAEQRARLLEILKQKGILSASDYDALIAPASAQVAPDLIASTSPILPATAAASPPPEPLKPEAPKVIPAVAPLRVLQLEPAKQGGMIPDLKLGSGAKLKLYGMVKTTLIYDSSSPYGTDMPLPGSSVLPATPLIPAPPAALSFMPRRDSRASARTLSGPTSPAAVIPSPASWSSTSKAISVAP